MSETLVDVIENGKLSVTVLCNKLPSKSEQIFFPQR